MNIFFLKLSYFCMTQERLRRLAILFVCSFADPTLFPPFLQVLSLQFTVMYCMRSNKLAGVLYVICV